MTLEEFLRIIRLAIKKGKEVYHPDYDHVVTLAKDCTDLATGRNIRRFIEIFDRRESSGEFEQRMRLTTENLSAAYGPVLAKFQRPQRLQSIKREFITKKENHKKNFEEALLGFPEGGYEDFLSGYYALQGLYDPNSYVAIEFINQDKKNRPYGIFYSSDQVIDFARDYFGNLQYVLVHYKEKGYDAEDKVLDVAKYILYSGTYQIQFTQMRVKGVDRTDYIPNEAVLNAPFLLDENDNRSDLYAVEVYTPEFSRVQAVCLGYIKDDETRNRTFKSPLSRSLSTAKELIRLHSNKVLSGYLHVFPQKLAKLPVCDYRTESNDKCDGGKLGVSGVTCPKCKGTGVKIATQPDDTIYITMRNDGFDSDMKLTDLVAYVKPDVDSYKTISTEVKALENKLFSAVFSSEPTARVEVTQESATATEISKQREDINDTLTDWCKGFTAAYLEGAHIIAEIVQPPKTKAKDFTIVYEIPKDLKLSTVDELQDALKKAYDSNASTMIIRQYQDDIAAKMYEGDPEALKRYRVKAQFLPFLGYTDEQITFGLQNGLIRKRDAVARSNEDVIFDELEQQDPAFYDLDFPRQNEMFETKLKEIMGDLEKDNPPLSVGVNVFGSRTDNPNNDPNLES